MDGDGGCVVIRDGHGDRAAGGAAEAVDDRISERAGACKIGVGSEGDARSARSAHGEVRAGCDACERDAVAVGIGRGERQRDRFHIARGRCARAIRRGGAGIQRGESAVAAAGRAHAIRGNEAVVVKRVRREAGERGAGGDIARARAEILRECRAAVNGGESKLKLPRRREPTRIYRAIQHRARAAHAGRGGDCERGSGGEGQHHVVPRAACVGDLRGEGAAAYTDIGERKYRAFRQSGEGAAHRIGAVVLHEQEYLPERGSRAQRGGKSRAAESEGALYIEQVAACRSDVRFKNRPRCELHRAGRERGDASAAGIEHGAARRRERADATPAKQRAALQRECSAASLRDVEGKCARGFQMHAARDCVCAAAERERGGVRAVAHDESCRAESHRAARRTE